MGFPVAKLKPAKKEKPTHYTVLLIRKDGYIFASRECLPALLGKCLKSVWAETDAAFVNVVKFNNRAYAIKRP